MGWKPNWGPILDPVAKKRAYQRVKTQLKELMLTGDYRITYYKQPNTYLIAIIHWEKGYHPPRRCNVAMRKDGSLALELTLGYASNESKHDITPDDEEAFASTVMEWLDKDYVFSKPEYIGSLKKS